MFRRHVAVVAVAVLSLGGWTPAHGAEDDPIVATVNGVEILRSEVKEAHRLLPREYSLVPFEMIFPNLLDSLIDTRLSAADARARKIDTEDAVKEQLLGIETRLLQRIVLQREIDAGLTDEAIQERYDEMIEKGGKEEIHVRHILLKTEEDAKAVIEQLGKGADFAGLAKTHSTGPTAADGGDLGFFGKGQMVPSFETAAFGLEARKYTEAPVKTQFGWHIIKLDDRRAAEPPKLADVIDQIRTSISQKVGGAYLKRLRDDAEISRYHLDGSPMTAQ